MRLGQVHIEIFAHPIHVSNRRNTTDELFMGVTFLGDDMDQIEAEKNIKKYVAELGKYNNLDRSLLSRDEMIMIDNKIITLKERIKFLRSNP